jgi:hypothetical protein
MRRAEFALVTGGRATWLPEPKAGETRKWRRKPLESLKTDSGMAIRQLTAAGNENRSREFRTRPLPIPDQRPIEEAIKAMGRRLGVGRSRSISSRYFLTTGQVESASLP